MRAAARKTNLEDIPVKKGDLLRKLQENKDKHEAEWKEAWQGYQAAWLKDVQKEIDRVNRMVTKATEAKNEERMVRFPKNPFNYIEIRAPVNHVKDYEMAIDTIEAYQTSTRTDDGKLIDDGIIVLSVDDFNCYYRDEWDWRSKHEVSLMNYSSNSVSNNFEAIEEIDLD